MNRRNVITGQQLSKRLLDALGLPKRTTWFNLHAKVGEAVRVRCGYYPESADGGLEIAEAIAEFELHRRPDRHHQRPPKAAPVSVSIRVDLGIIENQMRCVQGAVTATATGDRIGFAIESAALRALNEIQRMADAARRSHGIETPDTTIALRIEGSPA